MKFVAGLGNPGDTYLCTRHNLGFWVVDAYLHRYRVAADRKKNDAHCVDWNGITWIKPQTFMNLSGRSILKFLKYSDSGAKDLLVIHDEADLPEGVVRLKFDGGSGGHNGLESIIAELGATDFYRLRVGVGKAEGRQLSDFLLEKTSSKLLSSLAEKGAEALGKILDLGPAKAMNDINRSD